MQSKYDQFHVSISFHFFLRLLSQTNLTNRSKCFRSFSNKRPKKVEKQPRKRKCFRWQFYTSLVRSGGHFFSETLSHEISITYTRAKKKKYKIENCRNRCFQKWSFKRSHTYIFVVFSRSILFRFCLFAFFFGCRYHLWLAVKPKRQRWFDRPYKFSVTKLVCRRKKIEIDSICGNNFDFLHFFLFMCSLMCEVTQTHQYILSYAM